MDKEAIRAAMLSRRGALSSVQAARLSNFAQQRFITSGLFAAVCRLALYSPLRNETATTQIFAEACRQGKLVYYPRVVGEYLHFVRIETLEQLVPGAYGVLEPDNSLQACLQEPELVLVPGVAFDRRGHRLGYGRGYYDRYLEGCSDHVVRVGFGYSFQLCDLLPIADHDQQLDALTTDTQTITWRRKSSGLT